MKLRVLAQSFIILIWSAWLAQGFCRGNIKRAEISFYSSVCVGGLDFLAAKELFKDDLGEIMWHKNPQRLIISGSGNRLCAPGSPTRSSDAVF